MLLFNVHPIFKQPSFRKITQTGISGALLFAYFFGGSTALLFIHWLLGNHSKKGTRTSSRA